MERLESAQTLYNLTDARARVCQDIVLKAISKSSLSRNVTIKGGVVMRSVTGDIRRATQDIDIDFIKYSLSDESIELFIKSINCINGIKIVRIGEIEELSQQDYSGKRIFVTITDDFGNSIDTKIDLGVHKYLEIEQEEYCFDIAFDDEGVSLLINSREQMFVEKLRSLLKFGEYSTRYKDIYDMFYQCDKVDSDKIIQCLCTYIFNDAEMRENKVEEIINRVATVFKNPVYRYRVDNSDKRWLDDEIEDVFATLLSYLESLTHYLTKV